jgi:hypothetical protein
LITLLHSPNTALPLLPLRSAPEKAYKPLKIIMPKQQKLLLKQVKKK